MTKHQSFDSIWEQKYAEGHGTRYPWDSVVSFVFRNAPRDRPCSEIKILEIGCGTGANLWFAAREGFSVTGVDASVSAIEMARKRFQEDKLDGCFHVADFLELPLMDNTFDLVIDRAALTCSGYSVAKRAVLEVYRVMKKEGRFFFNPYSDRHSSHSAGIMESDSLVMDISGGSLVNVGQICFYSKQQIIVILEGFRLLSLQHMEYQEMLQAEYLVHAEWRAIAQK